MRRRTTHRLKTINPYFTEAWQGNKPFEYRKNDRDYQVGDRVELFEYDPALPEVVSNTREIHGVISYVLRGRDNETLGLSPEYCIFTYRETGRIGIGRDNALPL